MLDIGWPELLVVAIVLIIVVGPKDLPPMLRAFGRTTKKLRGMANEFRGQFDEALREAELDDVKKTFDDARKAQPDAEHSRCGQSAEGYGEFHPFGHRKDRQRAVRDAVMETQDRHSGGDDEAPGGCAGNQGQEPGLDRTEG